MYKNIMEKQNSKDYIKAFLDGLENDKRESWLPDSAVSACFKCFILFSFSQRKHHCRVCGNIFCTACCTNKSLAKYNAGTKFLRVCEKCYRLITEFIKELEHTENRRKFYCSNSNPYEKISESLEESKGDNPLSKIEQEHMLRICKKLCEENKIPEEIGRAHV